MTSSHGLPLLPEQPGTSPHPILQQVSFPAGQELQSPERRLQEFQQSKADATEQIPRTAKHSKIVFKR